MEDELQLVVTGDGSPSVFSSRFGQHYHSTFGAVTESMIVFIRNGLQYYLSNSNQLFTAEKPLRIFEMGFGTGLNAQLTYSETSKLNLPTHYTAIEAFPLPDNLSELFLNSGLHLSATEGMHQFGGIFTLELHIIHLEQWDAGEAVFNVIFFDAFSPDVQPELWSEAIFQQMYNRLAPGGILVTYCVKGVVVRALKAAGFAVEKLPGPPGKRHVLRALKNN
jgi:tRNA U34 5-methylaminomethyl-2-thiouridine-forming methyltransferase MnmC